MTAQSIICLCLFALLIICVQVRAAMLRRRGIRAMVFGQTSKSDFVLVPFVAGFVYTLLAATFGFPIWNPLIHPIWESIILGWVGIALCAIAVAGFVATLISFGDSFRVGIDVNKPDKLVQNGMFAISRNPIYVCFLLFFMGLLLVYRNIVIAITIILFALVIHRQVLREESFLAEHYGNEYEAYCKKVRRYL